MKKEKKDIVKTIRFDAHLAMLVKELSDIKGVTQSEVIRGLINRSLKKIEINKQNY